MRVRKIQIAPSVLACDFNRMEQDVARIAGAGVELLHLDFMDGHFVPNLSFGFPIAEALKKSFPHLLLDVHLMVTNPEFYLERLAALGVYQVSVHWETCPNLHRTLQQIHSLGMKAGVAINPHTPLQGLEFLRDYLDNILIMTVNPGFGGQAFLSEVLPKVRQAREFCDGGNRLVSVGVDGGVDDKTAVKCLEHGASLLIAGSYLFKASDPVAALAALQTTGV